MREARVQSSQPLTDCEAVECVVRAALVQQSRTRLSLSRRPSPHTRLARGAEDRSGRNRNCEDSLARATQSGLSPQCVSEEQEATQSGSSPQCVSGGQEATQSGVPLADTERTENGGQSAVDSPEAQLGATSMSGGFGGREDSVDPVPKECRAEAGEPAEPGQRQQATASGSSGESFVTRRAPLSSDARQLLELIKGGKLWNVATLGCETGMSLQRLAVALTDLEFSRRVRRDVVGFYEFVGDPDDEPPFREAS